MPRKAKPDDEITAKKLLASGWHVKHDDSRWMGLTICDVKQLEIWVHLDHYSCGLTDSLPMYTISAIQLRTVTVYRDLCNLVSVLRGENGG